MAATLDFYLGKSTWTSNEALSTAGEQLKTMRSFGPYTVMNTTSPKPGELLLVTQVNAGDKIYSHNFLVSTNTQEMQLEIYTLQYKTHDEGKLMKAFAKDVFAIIHAGGLGQS